jgi:predicted ArsR family transcriptional regulator
VTPTFAEATRAFRDFLAARGWPTELVWVQAKDVLRGRPIIVYRNTEDADADVARDYETSLERGLAVRIDAICTLGDATCATVTSSAGDGLEMSVAEPRTEGEVRWPAC